MALTPPRSGRLLLLLITACAVAACATATATGVRPTPSHWLLLGEAVDTAGLTPLLAEHPSDPVPPRITDLSVPGAGIEAVIRQLAVLPERPPDRFILRLGEADLRAAVPLSPQRYGDLVAALLVTLRHRAPVAVTTVPERAPGPGTVDTLTAARRLRLAAEYNEAIRVAARLHGVTLLGAPPAGAGDHAWWPAGPAEDALRARAERGAALGLRPDTFAKVGDSITSSRAFLRDLSEDALRASGQERLIEAFRSYSPEASPAAGRAAASPFARESLAARDRWSVADALVGGDGRSPLAAEIDALRPAVALVMFGTNDLTHLPVAAFEEDLDRLLTALDERGVVALLSTIPERRDSPEFAARVPAFNRAIRALALAHGVPLIDLHAALAPLPNAGLAPDGIHPSVCPDGAAVLTPACLQYGHNLRNLVTLRALARLRSELSGPSLALSGESSAGR